MECKFKVGDWVITKAYSENYDGRALKITRIDNNTYYYFEVGDNGYYNSQHNFGKESILRKAEPHEIPVKSKKESPNLDLLEEAKRRYPVGTKFYPAHLSGEIEEDVYCIITDDTEFKFIGDSIYATVNGNTYFSADQTKYGNTSYNRCLYNNKKWAEIVSSTESKLDVQGTPRSQFKIGDKVRVLSESHGWGDVKKGDIGVVREINSNSLSVDFPSQSFWIGKPECFELVEENVHHEFEWELKIDSIKDYTIQPLDDYLKIEQSFDKPIKIKRVSNKRKLTIV